MSAVRLPAPSESAAQERANITSVLRTIADFRARHLAAGSAEWVEWDASLCEGLDRLLDVRGR